MRPVFAEIPGHGVLGREGQAVHRVDNRAAGEGWGQSGLSCLAERGVLSCRIGFSSGSTL